MKILVNAIKCKHCGDIIESTSVHDFKWCRCGKCAVDGGHQYLKRSFVSPDDFIEMSVTKPETEEYNELSQTK